MTVYNLLYNTVKELAVSRFKKPTLIQELVIPKVLEGKNILAITGTGLGKTEAAALPIFSKLSEKEYKPIALLYITPLKSLNRDMLDRLLWWCQKLDLDASVRHGDTTQYERKLQVEHPPHILITTPEQLQGMLIGKRLRKLLENIKFIIIDEIHELVENKRGVQLTVALERLKELCGDPQIITLSATIGSPRKAAEFIFGSKKYEIIKALVDQNIDLKVDSPFPSIKDKELAEKIYIGESVAARLRKIYDLVKAHRSALTFTNTREAAEVLSSRLRTFDTEFLHEVHHSSLSKEVRVKAENDFKKERLKSLICTSSLELGIDIGSVDLVVQYMSPRQVTKLVQRVGRSGHGVGRVSKGFIVAADGDDIFESAVIARKAIAGNLEPLKCHENSLDVLAHQIIGLTMFSYSIDPKKSYELIKNAQPFSTLSEETFTEIVKFLQQLGFIYIDKEIKRKRRAFDYYFQNLSVIPDNKSYRVIDNISNTAVGTLDEQFIATHGEVGSSFIVRGRPWKVLSVENGKVYVEAINDIESAIPAWEGELIPVPYDIAQEVGALRKKIGDMINKLKDKKIVEKIKEEYPVSSQTASKMVGLIKKQIKGYNVPNNENIFIENLYTNYDTNYNYIILHACFGTTVNETLSRFISALLSAEYGEVIVSRSDPYRMIFRGCKIEDIKKIFGYKAEDLQIVLEKTLPNSSLFKWRFVHTAKRFGVIQKGASFDKINLDKMVDAYRFSPIFDETLKELFTEKLNLKKSEEILEKIKNNEIKIIEIKGLSPIARLGFTYELHDVVKPDKPEKEIFKIVKKRLMSTEIRLICMNCGKYTLRVYIKNLEKEPRCKKCASKLLAVLRPYQIELKDIIKKRLNGKDLSIEEQKRLEYIKQTADLVINYGKQGIICLAGRGVGPKTAFRILSKFRKDENDLYKYILEAEREFIKTKKFWSN